MVIESADRFGLAQLHQLRGRVGRGAEESWCFLMAEPNERLKILQETSDGFRIAQKDLELRGAGEVFGTRQHGLPAFEVGSLVNDMTTLQDAQAEAATFLSSEELPARPEYAPLMERIRALFAEDSTPN
jgi:ATP-dependent DNA helicase RecG